MRRLASRGAPDHQLITTDISTQIPATPAGDERKEPRWERKRRDAEENQARAMALLEQMTASIGGILALTKAPPPNDVLLQGTYVVGAGGTWENSWEQAFAAVGIANLSAAVMYATSFAAGETAAKTGAGVIIVPSGIWRLVPMRGTALTIYGTAGATFDLQVFVRPRTPAAGSCGQA